MSDTFTREEAVQAIIAMDNPQPEQDANLTKTDEDTAIQAEEEISSNTEPTSEDDTSEAKQPGDGEETGEEVELEAEANPIDAPNWWDAEAKGKFQELPPELQEIVKAQEDKREAITQKFKQQAVEAQRQYDAQVKELASLAERANTVFEKAEDAFKSRWDGMTPEVWQELFATDPGTAVQLKFEYDTEQEQLRQVSEARRLAAEQAQQQHYAEQRTKLQEIAPELAANPNRLQSVGKYIVDSGIPPEAIASATAEELNIVYKAMKYDEMQARARAAKETAVVTPPKPAPQKSIASAPGREVALPPQERQVQEIKNRLAQTKSRDDLAALFKIGAFG